MRDPTGRTMHTIFVFPRENVLAVRKKVQDETGIPLEHSRLVYSGKQLEDSKTLHDYEVGKECMLQLMVHQRGGSP